MGFEPIRMICLSYRKGQIDCSSAGERKFASRRNKGANPGPLLLFVWALACAIVLSLAPAPTGFVPDASAQPRSQEGDSRASGDNVAWRTARRENTCSSYQLYLRNYPRGRYMRDARARMKNCGRRTDRPDHRVRRSERARWGYYPRYRYPIWPRHRYRPWPRPPITVRPPLPIPPVVDPDWGVEPPIPDIDPDWGVDIGGGDFDAMPLPSFDFD